MFSVRSPVEKNQVLKWLTRTWQRPFLSWFRRSWPFKSISAWGHWPTNTVNAPCMLKMLQLSKEKNRLRTERIVPFKKGDKVVNLAITFWPFLLQKNGIIFRLDLQYPFPHRGCQYQELPFAIFSYLEVYRGRRSAQELAVISGQNWNSDTELSVPKCNKLNIKAFSLLHFPFAFADPLESHQK